MTRYIFLYVALVAAVSVATPVQAAMFCGDRLKIISFLNRDFQESLSCLGLANGAVIELYTAKTGTWTMLATTPDGTTCVIGNGENWVTSPPLAPTSFGVEA